MAYKKETDKVWNALIIAVGAMIVAGICGVAMIVLEALK